MAVNASPSWMVPSARLWRMRLTQVAAAGPVLVVIAGVAAGLWAGAWAAAAAAAVVAVAAGSVLWVERRRYLAWAYREREEDLIVSRGVLVRRVSVVPYGRMQFVEVTAGPFERVFRLATVQLHTAAAASDARIPGLEQDEAARLRDRLAMLGEARAARPVTEDPEHTRSTEDAGAAVGADWHRLHPLSPLIRVGRLLSGLLGIFALSLVTADGNQAYLYQLIVAAGLLVTGFVRWLVTRWKLDGATLRIETGLLRRDSRQLPMTRIQAVDVVRPFLARLLGLAALRIRLAGAGDAGDRLAYLTVGEAARLRATLLAGQHGLDPATPEPAELPVITVPTGRVIGATLLRAAPRFLALAVIATVAATAAPGFFLASESTVGVIALGLVTRTWQQVTGRYGFTVATSPDGIRIRRGLLSTVAETIPFRRVQAVRLVQPLLWRPFGWCKLVVDVAGVAGRDSGPKSGGLTKALLPVGYMNEAQHLVRLVFGHDMPELTRPPKRARVKAPLSYHFLAAGHNQVMAVTVTGRVCKKTVYMRLEKLQSVRLTQGPAQRRLSLASVHGDAAGRRAHAVFSDRRADQARGLLDDLAYLSRSARSAESSS